MERSQFLKLLSAIPGVGGLMGLKELEPLISTFPKTKKLPVIFTSHGSPMDMLGDTSLFKVLRQTGMDIRNTYDVHAVLIVSAHWNTTGTFVNVSKSPATIYDFTGFPAEFYKVKYSAPGSPELAREIMSLSQEVAPSTDWGFDHGSWPILRHLFPNAEVPVVQMSMDYNKSAHYHYQLARKLTSLREKGVLIIGSGSIVHNIPLAIRRFRSGDPSPYGWEVEFDNWVTERLADRDFVALVDYQKATFSDLAVPTPDHFVPLLYALGVADSNEPIQSIHQGMFAGFSDRSFRIG